MLPLVASQPRPSISFYLSLGWLGRSRKVGGYDGVVLIKMLVYMGVGYCLQGTVC